MIKLNYFLKKNGKFLIQEIIVLCLFMKNNQRVKDQLVQILNNQRILKLIKILSILTSLKLKKNLIVENFVHLEMQQKVLNYFLKYDCKLIINKKHKNKIEKFQNKIIFFSGPKFLIYFYILIISNKYDYIIISTLPEYPENLNNLKNILFNFKHYLSFFISFSNIKSKLIFQIRNINAFVPRKKTFLTSLRNILLNLSDKYIFENKYLANKYKNRNNFKNKKISYQYINHLNSENGKIDFKNNYIGILGGIDASKKDYDLLFNALKRLFKNDLNLVLFFWENQQTKIQSISLKDLVFLK